MALTGLALISCSPMVDERGHVGLDRERSNIIAGIGSQEVRSRLGSPSSTSTFGDPVWYYIRTVNETKAFLRPEVARQQVFAVYFDESGMVTKTEEYTIEDGQRIHFSNDETSTEGNEMGVIEQLLGNMGRFNSGTRDAAEQ